MSTTSLPSYSKPGDVKYAATVGREDVTIIQSRYAGISGPAGEFPLPNASDDPDESVSFSIEELTTHVEAKGYRVISTWRAVVCYDGIRLEADVLPV